MNSPAMAISTRGHRPARTATRSSLVTLLGFCVVLAGSLAGFALLPASLLSISNGIALSIGTFFLLACMVCFRRFVFTADAVFPIAIFCWWCLIVSEQVFVRKGLSEMDLSGHFSGSAYSEFTLWVVIFCAIMAVLVKHGMSRAALRPMKWPLLFALLAIGSCVLSPTPAFSLAWAFKLFVSVLILTVCAGAVADPHKQWTFFQSIFWAYVVLVFMPLLTALTHPSTLFGWRGFDGSLPPEFRLNTNIHPVDLAQHAGLLVLLGLTLHALDRRRSRLVVVWLASAVMILAVGKAAILSCFLCALLFFLLQRRFGAGAGWLVSLVVLATVALLFTPIGSYFQQYKQDDDAATLTGRTQLWDLALPAIEQQPLLGHGFMSSKYIAEAVDADWDAGQLHNAFLEVLYNNGCLGLTLVLAMNVCILRNTWVALRHSRSSETRALVSGTLAIYFFLLLNGLVEPTFGGRPSCVFMVFEGLVVLSYGLRRRALAQPRSLAPVLTSSWSPVEVHN